MTYPLADMTCVVGTIDGRAIILGADSAAVGEGPEIYTPPEPKVFASGPYLLGVCGSYRVAQVLRYRAELPTPPEPTDLGSFLVRDLVPMIGDLLESEGVVGSSRAFLGEKVALLLGYEGQLWHVSSDLTVLPEVDFGAIGSGRLRAYAALHALKAAGVEPARRRLELALETAAKYTATVRPPWTFLRGEPTV
ncbi:MAG: hypothetical protein GY722_29595 [bacterium]|nr:hypothetical protein [bacterium]